MREEEIADKFLLCVGAVLFVSIIIALIVLNC